MKHNRQVPLSFRELPTDEMNERALEFRELMTRRRTVRDFSDRPVPRALIEQCVMTAATAPSGANQQPWTFVCIADPATKHEIRLAAEEEERTFYAGRASTEWLEALAPIGTDANKPFLETAPWLIAIFAQRYGVGPGGKRTKHYYVPESVGIATGLLIASLHNAGLATLTHTPSPMGFLNAICGRPESEKALILLVAGYPAEDAQVPDIARKRADEVIVWRE
ncbi:oxidoreductase [Mesorhizobium sp. L-8-10]|uniref:nitroreductase family protein n=1 Tax=unclassified Mesorhizobium TaxID=325217 RepID=UPI00192654B6|nr:MULTISPECIES: nitroreductase family protein [unclassified Mesorhizobium]BCH21374.1 oxidoreductase [Mesorhizobium sp. L-8-3]BCH29208.1 oxidoreductase [Mesorhizobium sp. L-8-10]